MFNANDVAAIILTRVSPWTDAMKLQKLLYYTQAWHLAITDRPLFREPVEAWIQGPVVYDVWSARQDRATRRASSQHIENIELDDVVSNLIDLVITQYGSMSGEELSALTHVERPWRDARGDLPDDAPSHAEISREAMASYYRRHRILDGRTAVDLAAGGIHVESTDTAHDYDELLALLDDDLPDDTWGGANLHPPVPVPAARERSGAVDNQDG